MNNIITLRIITPIICLFILVFFNSCAPVFSEMQSARTAGKNQVEGTASFSSVGFSEDGESNHIQNHVGFQAAYGLSDAVDIRVRYAAVWLDGDIGEVNANILAVGPKFSLIKDRLSGYLPIGFAFGSDVDSDVNTWQFHPTLLGTIPIIEKLDINPSFKVLIPFESESTITTAFNLGLGIKLSETLTVRPEYGMLFEPGEPGSFSQFGIGVTLNARRNAR